MTNAIDFWEKKLNSRCDRIYNKYTKVMNLYDSAVERWGENDSRSEYFLWKIYRFSLKINEEENLYAMFRIWMRQNKSAGIKSINKKNDIFFNRIDFFRKKALKEFRNAYGTSFNGKNLSFKFEEDF